MKTGVETFEEVQTSFILGGAPVLADEETIVSGAGVLVAGTVLGKITASGKYKTALAASNDGSETPHRILAVDVDATAADVKAPAYKAGNFDPDNLTLGTGITVAALKAAFDGTPIFIASSPIVLQS